MKYVYQQRSYSITELSPINESDWIILLEKKSSAASRA